MPDETKQPNSQPSTPTQPNVADIIKKGNEIYESIKAELEPTNNGKYVVIEVASKRHFIGETRTDAVIEAKKAFPDTVMFVKRIGGAEKSSRHLHQYQQRYARLF